MRDLASEAGVNFATPFNQFGSKAAIMHAISARRVELMDGRFRGAAPSGDALDRVLVAVEMAASVMPEEPVVNRSVMGLDWHCQPGGWHGFDTLGGILVAGARHGRRPRA